MRLNIKFESKFYTTDLSFMAVAPLLLFLNQPL
jgi:hypothetical protein